MSVDKLTQAPLTSSIAYVDGLKDCPDDHKPHEGYEDGWLDACNTVKWHLEAQIPTQPAATANQAAQPSQGLPMKFELNQFVSITASGESGIVIGRAEYANSENSYLLRYRAADGRAVETWWQESALRAVSD